MAKLLECNSQTSKHSVNVLPTLVTKEATKFFKPDRILEGTNILHKPGSQVILN
jgi:hypothetical protein